MIIFNGVKNKVITMNAQGYWNMGLNNYCNNDLPAVERANFPAVFIISNFSQDISQVLFCILPN